ncbi:zinc-dependent alcohol dehydrogenase [Paenibacillus eucommiae]|uniref:2-desacetyl-2-hydroxyethyl bacteriochlorophyllide A dehydrogenase n=1 Tax=Paenibacillus eucommiae TaxID=1355755 RepID=A0ABS4IV82_9BACL|nr:zinc-binding alcohol dehydrogenase [Paenibacillus eucommiae]MBP1991490.1 2-desacetyl-2-hydroxyethyl bacteriochlorophyllide A dehydrogenase [Paenibacillus eucommiae]
MKAAKSSNGQLKIVDIPMHELTKQSVLVKTDYSALSTGTELMVLGFANVEVFLGYSGTGVVEAVGEEVTHVQVGQRVACYGVPTHAEYFLANKNHVTPVPEHVDAQEAAFAGIATIGVQALRQADLRFGETIVVLGLGILGQLLAQMARAAAYRVIAVDHMEERCQLLDSTGLLTACRNGEEVKERIQQLTGGKGADAVMICASSKSHKLIDQGLEWIRDKGKIVIVGDTNTEFDRNALFAKEAQITISRAGGPGRYDTEYEQEGRDYPYGYIRWTLARNLEEFVRLLADGRLNIKPLISNIYSLEDIGLGYQQAKDDPRKTMGMLVKF